MLRSLRLCALFFTLLPCLLSADEADIPRLVLPTPHGESVYHMTTMPDGRFAISGTQSGQLKLWDVSTGTELKTITLGLASEKRLLAILVRNAAQIYAVTSDRVVIFEIPTLKILNTIESRREILHAEVSPDGESLWLGSSSDQKNILQVLRRGRFPIREVMERARPSDSTRGWGFPEVSPDGRYAIITDSHKHPTVIVRTEDAQVVHTLPRGTAIPNVADSGRAGAGWTADSRLVISRGMGPDGKQNLIEIINPDSLQVEWSTELKTESPWQGFALQDHGRPGDPLIFKSIERFFFLDGTTIDGPYASSGFTVSQLATVDSRFVVCSTTQLDPQTNASTTQLRKFDRARGSYSSPWSPPVHQTTLFAASSRADTMFVTGHGGGRLLQLDRGGLRITYVPIRKIYDALFAPDGQSVIFNGGEHDDRTSGIISLNRPDQPRLSKMPFESVSRGARGNIVLSPSGKLAVDMRNGQSPVIVYDPYSGNQLCTFTNGYYSYDQTTGSAAISPDDKRIVYYTSEKDTSGRSVHCYDITTGAKIWSRHQLNHDFATFRFSSDGKQIFAVGFGFNQRLYVFNADTGESIREHELPQTSQAAQATFNPTGTEVALPFDDSIIFASLADGKELRRATSPAQRVERLSYLGDDRLASVGADKAIRIWNVTRAELLGAISFSGDGKEWAFIHPSGRFEATPGFQEQMYFIQGTTKVPLSAYFESYHTPGLIGQIMAGETIAAPTIQLKDLTEPPKVFLALAGSTRNLTVEDAPEEVTSEQASLRITAQSEQSKISEIRLYHNGKLVESRTRNLTVEDDVPDIATGKAGRTETIAVTLLPGENTFRAVALNEQRTESAPALLSIDYKAPTSASPATAALTGRDGGGMQLHLLVIGVNTYRNPKYNLNYAVPDATAVRDLVQKNATGIFTKVNVTTFFNDKATRSAILESFTTIAQQSGPRDVFVFYFAGHGVMSSDAKPEFFLAPYELTQLYGADEQLRAKAISSAELLAASAKISAQKQLFLLDACQSAGALQTVAMRGASEEKAVAQLARASGTHWITASGSEQFATEFEKLGHGTFTYALLEALGGKADNGDGRITVNELKAYLETQVPELTKLHKGTPQYPASYGFGQDFPLSVISKN
ncbi:hypothetical protein CMV30_18495 [Nibricoccus aquaticus]|uniref:Uncharacterized protein n=1 Tax=Nibricoccus aquaticus TaxID=2576891 RepID=A0A290QHJ7_9BACT|nr:caspase family protein [Nibricoccus aquaticus]ATC65776.1 hypothetical protein CMV30_18495 [Nibricoccus aquaticus]